jgi:lysophospholipase L1-like esterase
MSANLFDRYPWLTRTALLGTALLIVAGLLGADVFREADGAGRYSLIDWLNYRIRCSDGRHIVLREPRPGLVTRVDDADLRIDENGFVRPSKLHDSPDLSIFFIGGSTTMCRAVAESKRFPYLVGRALEEDLGLSVNSYNAGIPGADTLHSINLLINKVLPLKPDVVVLMHAINDVAVLYHEGSLWNAHPTRSHLGCTRVGRPSREDRVKEWANRGAHDLITTKGGLTPLREEFATNLFTFIAIARTKGIVPVLMTQFNRIQLEPGQVSEAEWMPSPAFRDLYMRFQQLIRDVGAAADVLVVDLAEELPPEKRYFFDVVHLNELGSMEVADIIARKLGPTLAKSETEPL